MSKEIMTPQDFFESKGYRVGIFIPMPEDVIEYAKYYYEQMSKELIGIVLANLYNLQQGKTTIEEIISQTTKTP